MGKIHGNLPKGYIDQSFLSYLENQGFQVMEIIGDGNCMFRSIADLIDNDQEKHDRYRRLAVQHIALHPVDFKNFLESSFDGTLDHYLKKMGKDGTWGGQIELETLSRVLKTILRFHRFQRCLLYRKPNINSTGSYCS